MKLSRWLGLLGLWVCLGVAVVWCETRDLRVRQLVSDLHREKKQLMEDRAKRLVSLHERTSPPRLLDSVRRLDLDLVAPGEEPEKKKKDAARARRRGTSARRQRQ